MSQLLPEKSGRALLMIALLVLAVYAQTLFSSFHFDDYAIFADRVLTSPDGWWRVFRPAQTRPLTYFTFWLNYQLGEADPWGYHAVNLAVHVTAVLAAAAVFRRIASPLTALMATAIFALHPLQTEAVAYVFARATLLATLFCLLAWRDWLTENRWRAAGWFLLGLLAKEECVAFPLFLLVTRRGQYWPAWTSMLAGSVAAGIRLLYVAAHTQGAGLGPSAGGIKPLTYLLAQPTVIWRYLLLFVAPVGQNFDHHIQVYSGCAFALAGLIVLAAWKRSVGVWLLGSLVLLAPSSSVIPLADLIFEHRMYLPMISLAVGAAMLLARLPRPVLIGLVLLMAAGSWARVRVWKTEETLWADASAKSPGKVRPKLQLARAIGQRDPERAESLLLDARRLESQNPETFTQMGALMLEQRNPYGALIEFDEALRLQSQSADAHSNRGTALYLLGRQGEAEMEFRRALEIDPCHANARHNLRLMNKSALPACQ